jgi:thiamine pyrophosphokinase
LRAAIFLNGAPDPPDLLRRIADRADLVVAADGGARYALDAGVVPDLVVGDMDSLGEVREIEEQGTLLERHPVRKDKMDGHLAVLAVRDRGATAVDLLCAAGGRFSALFAVPHILLASERMGLRATMVADWGRVFVLEAGSRTVTGDPQDSVSVFPLTGPATGVTLEGFDYPLENARLEPGDTLGFHNELIGGAARVSVEEGVLLVIHETKGVTPSSGVEKAGAYSGEGLPGGEA